MNICDTLKDKIIIVAEHDCISAQHIISTLKNYGLSDVRNASNGKQIYDILRPFHDHPEKIGLIVVNEQLPDCNLVEMSQSLSCTADGSVIPFIIIKSKKSNESLFPTDSFNYLIYPITLNVGTH